MTKLISILNWYTYRAYPAFGRNYNFLHSVDIFLAIVGKSVSPGVLEDVFILFGEVAEKVPFFVLFEAVGQNVNIVVVDLCILREREREDIR